MTNVIDTDTFYISQQVRNMDDHAIDNYIWYTNFIIGLSIVEYPNEPERRKAIVNDPYFLAVLKEIDRRNKLQTEDTDNQGKQECVILPFRNRV